MKPWNYHKGKKYPVAFIVHGGPLGSMGNDFHYRWNPAIYAGMGYAVVFIDFHGSTGYGQAFTDSIRSEEHTSELQSLMRISYAVFCLKKKKTQKNKTEKSTEHQQ